MLENLGDSRELNTEWNGAGSDNGVIISEPFTISTEVMKFGSSPSIIIKMLFRITEFDTSSSTSLIYDEETLNVYCDSDKALKVYLRHSSESEFDEIYYISADTSTQIKLECSEDSWMGLNILIQNDTDTETGYLSLKFTNGSEIYNIKQKTSKKVELPSEIRNIKFFDSTSTFEINTLECYCADWDPTSLLEISTLNDCDEGCVEDQCYGIIVANCYECEEGYYLDTSKSQCDGCDKTCLTCTGSETTDCETCDIEKGLIYNAETGECVCDDGYFFSETKCQQCHHFCSLCYGPSSSNCTQCKTGLNLELNQNTCQCKTDWVQEENSEGESICVQTKFEDERFPLYWIFVITVGIAVFIMIGIFLYVRKYKNINDLNDPPENVKTQM